MAIGIDDMAINFRQRPALCCIGKREQEMLLVEPDKSEILPPEHDILPLAVVRWHKREGLLVVQHLMRRESLVRDAIGY